MAASSLNRRLLLLLILLCSVQFFTFFIFPRQTMAVIEMFGALLILLTVLAYSFYGGEKELRIKKNYNVELVLLIVAVFLSVPMASIFHGQSFPITLFGMKFTYYLFLYYVLHFFKINTRELKNFIIALGVIWVVIYIIQWTIYPSLILNSRVDFQRGTIRIFFPGSIFATIAFFLLLQESLTKRIKFLNLLYLLSYFITVSILQGTRQSLVVLVFFTGLFLLLNREIKSKWFIILLSMVLGVSLFFFFYDIFMEMLNVTEKQMGNQQDPVRVRSARFFTGDFMQHPLTYFFGNGADHGSSKYGMKIIYYKLSYGFYQSDIGIIGHYSKFGVLYVLGQILIFFRIAFGKIPKSVNYLKYVVGIILFTLFTGGSVFGSSDGIAGIMMMIYLIDCEKYNDSQKES
jgi:hypothetical protein